MISTAHCTAGNISTEHSHAVQNILECFGISGADGTVMQQGALNILIIRAAAVIVHHIDEVFIHLFYLLIIEACALSSVAKVEL